MERGNEVDIESGALSHASATPCRNESESTLFSKLCDKYVVGFVEGEENCNGRSSVTGETWRDRLLNAEASGNVADRVALNEKGKKVVNKKPPKPPRPPRSPILGVADQKLIREITELAMLKRARVERAKALKKMKDYSNTSSSRSSSIIAMVFTTMFLLVMLFQGNFSSK